MNAEEAIVLLQWIFGVLGAIATAMFGIWWKIESRQDKKIDDLAKMNHQAHNEIYRQIDDNRKQMSAQHGQLRDKLEEIWKYLKNGSKE